MVQEKVKVLFWKNDFYGAITNGGMGSTHYGLVDGLKQLGHESAFVSSGRLNLPENSGTYYYVPHNKIFRNLPEILNFPYNRRTLKQVMKVIEKENPHFVYQHYSDFFYGGALLKRRTDLPLILQCDGVQQWIKRNWGKLYFPQLLKIAEEMSWEAADSIIAVSNELKQLMVEFGAQEDKIHVHTSGADPSLFFPEVDPAPVIKQYDLKGHYVVGFTGTFALWHGIEVLARAVKELTQRIPNVKVIFVGDGDLRNKIEDILKTDNVENDSIITGMVNFTSVPTYLAACDVLVSPCVLNGTDSLFFNSPVKLFEYLAMGKPIVATAVGQQGDVIQDRKNGLICEQNSPEDLVEKVCEIYNNPDLSANLANQAREDALKKHSWASNMEKTVKIYHDLMQKRENK